MTMTNIAPPPLLYWPSHHVDNAAAALEQARQVLADAVNLEWVSVAAEQYQVELSVLDERLVTLAALVSTCQDEWGRAAAVARAWGQL